MYPPKIRVCLVDDHPIMLQGLAMILADNPRFNVVATFRGGDEALEAFFSMPAFDVAVIDIMMPGIDGFEVMECVRRSLPESKALAHSALGELAAIRKAMDRGAAGFVHKSEDISVLVEAIERVHAQGVYFCPQSLKLISSDLKGSSAQSLTAREREIFELLKLGRSNKDISKELFVSYSTARFHIKNIYRKLGTSERNQLAD